MGRPNRLGDGQKRYNVGMSADLVARLWAESGRRQQHLSETIRELLAERLDQLDAQGPGS